MRTGLIALLLMLLVASSASAQQIDDQTDAQLKSGERKLWIGMALIVGGALIMPLTANGATGKSRALGSEATTAVGFGAVGAGTWLVWSGFHQRRRAVAPHIELGVAVGRQTGVIFRRTW